jgi:hypothetical protein
MVIAKIAEIAKYRRNLFLSFGQALGGFQSRQFLAIPAILASRTGANAARWEAIGFPHPQRTRVRDFRRI